jgi:uncharacterized protein YbjT (DUF2867 family)
MKRILVIGATGKVGRQVVGQLRETGARVRALTRNRDRAQFPGDVEVVEGDLTIPDTLEGSLKGMDAVFLVWVAPGPAVGPAMERIARHARRIVFLTAPLKTPHPFFQQPNPARAVAEQIERCIERSGAEWTFVRAGMFAANALHFWGPRIRAGAVVRWPYLNAATAPTHEGDIAAVAVRALCDEGRAGAEYIVTGPESLTQAEQLSTIERVTGSPVRIEEISREEARVELLPVLGSASVVDMLCGAWGAAIGLPAFISSHFQEVTGNRSRTFAEWVGDHAAQFRACGD